MPRHDTPKPHNGGQWTDARKRSFVMSALRRKHMQWGPVHAAKKSARVARGLYLCAKCKGTFRDKDVDMDHICAVIDPEHGFQSWDSVIERMYVEIDGYRCLCKACHAETTAQQREARKIAKKQKHT